MPYKVVVQFDVGPEKDPAWNARMHRILNLSEDLHRTFQGGDIGSHGVVDHATSSLVVDVRSRAKARTALGIVQDMVTRQFPEGIASVRLDHQSPT